MRKMLHYIGIAIVGASIMPSLVYAQIAAPVDSTTAHIPLATATSAGVVMPDNISTTVDSVGKLHVSVSGTSISQGCNVRPPAETTYSMAATDNGGCIEITNESAPETIQLPLPDAAGFYPFSVTIKNIGSSDSTHPQTMPTIIQPPLGTFISGQDNVLAVPYQAVKLFSDGTHWNEALSLPAPMWSKLGSFFQIPGYGLAEGFVQFHMMGSCNAGDVVGFQFSWWGQSPLTFSHSMTNTATCMKDALEDLAAQFQSNPAVLATIGGIVKYPAILPNGTSWLLQVDLSWPFADTMGAVATVIGAGSAESPSVNIQTVPTTDIGSGILCGHDTTPFGRPMKVGDGLCATIVTGGTNGQSMDLRDGLPFYEMDVRLINNPDPAIHSTNRHITEGGTFDQPGSISLDNTGLTISGSGWLRVTQTHPGYVGFAITPTVFANLSSCPQSYSEGSLSYIVDSTTASPGAITSGGGNHHVFVGCDSSGQWKVVMGN